MKARSRKTTHTIVPDAISAEDRATRDAELNTAVDDGRRSYADGNLAALYDTIWQAIAHRTTSVQLPLWAAEAALDVLVLAMNAPRPGRKGTWADEYYAFRRDELFQGVLEAHRRFGLAGPSLYKAAANDLKEANPFWKVSASALRNSVARNRTRTRHWYDSSLLYYQGEPTTTHGVSPSDTLAWADRLTRARLEHKQHVSSARRQNAIRGKVRRNLGK
jgi:hypothetical protein